MQMRLSRSLSVVAFVVGASAPAYAAVVQKVTFSGSQAAGPFNASTSITCADGSAGVASAFGFVSGASQISTSTGSPGSFSNGAFVEIDSYFNSCTGKFLGGADGGFANGFTTPDKKLSSAALVGSGTVQDFGSGLTVSFSVNLLFTGDGNTSQSKSNSHSKTIGSTGGPLTISHDHNANGNREAIVTGTITVDGVTMMPDFFFATMSTNEDATLTVSK